MKYIFLIMAVGLAFSYYRRIARHNGRVVKLIYLQILYNLVIKYIIGNLGLPSLLNYVTDAVLLWMLMEFFYHKKNRGLHIPNSLVVCTTSLWLITIVSYIFNVYSPFLYLWGFRNNFRFLLFGMMCAVYLRKRDVGTLMTILYGFFILNIIVVTYQAFFTLYSSRAIGDFISGLFSNGSERGGNASLDWLMCILCTYVIVKYLNKVGSLRDVAVCVTGSLYIAAVAEIKLFFVQIVIISIVSILICRKSFKVFIFTTFGVTSLVLGLRLLYYAFPGFANFFTYDVLMDYISRDSGYSSRGYQSGVNRLTAISYVFEHFLHTNTEWLFGIGLGNADTSSFSFLSSLFYKTYSWSGYAFFYSSFITIELGIMGLFGYITNVVNYLRNAIVASGKTAEERTLKQSVMIISIMVLLIIFSNQTMKLEASAYMVYAILAMPFVLSREDDDSEVGDTLVRVLPFKWGVKKNAL